MHNGTGMRNSSYSPVPRCHHLFQSMKNSLSGQKFKNVFNVQNFIDKFIVSKPE